MLLVCCYDKYLHLAIICGLRRFCCARNLHVSVCVFIICLHAVETDAICRHNNGELCSLNDGRDDERAGIRAFVIPRIIALAISLHYANTRDGDAVANGGEPPLSTTTVPLHCGESFIIVIHPWQMQMHLRFFAGLVLVDVVRKHGVAAKRFHLGSRACARQRSAFITNLRLGRVVGGDPSAVHVCESHHLHFWCVSL